MTPQRWKQINQIFHAAADLPSIDQEAFVRASAKTDPDLVDAVLELLGADRETGSYLDRPALADLRLAESLFPITLMLGDTLSSRFRIECELGCGGMGRVFKAYDTELRVHIALKIIRPEFAADVASIERFRQEVRLARAITHPNICRTYDLERDTIASADGRSADVLFLTMELLDGETLSHRIRRSGAISGDVFLHIAGQIAAGLDAAHRSGIIHRDIKPQNIFLVDTHETLPRVVITDFGLARSHFNVDGTFAPSITAEPVGTFSYMAPEQINGSAVTPAVDVYAYGLVIFEMLSGRVAFPAENLISSLTRRLKDPTSDANLNIAGVPLLWMATIHRCLDLNPEHRFQSAGRAASALLGKQRPRPSLSLKTRVWKGLLICVAVLALSFLGYRYYSIEAAKSLPKGTLLYLAPMENRSENRSMNNLTELLRSSLSQSAHTNLLDQGREADIVQQMKISHGRRIDAAAAREIAMRAGAARLILASVSGSDTKGYQLNIDIQEPDNTPIRYREHWTARFTWRAASSTELPSDFFASIRDAADWIRHNTGESANDIARLNTPPEDVTTSRWEALALFAEAQEFARLGQHEEAIISLQKATKIDPNFALAYARLGDLQASINRTNEAYQAYTKALDATLQQRLTLRERDRIKGYYAMDVWNYQGAVAAFRDYLLYYPDDASAQAYYGYALSEIGQTEPSIATLKKSYSLDPNRSATIEHLANYTLYAGDIDMSRYWGDRLYPKDPDLALHLLGMQMFYLRRFDKAQDAFQTLLKSKRWIMRSAAFAQLTRLAADRGQSQQATEAVAGALREALSAANPAREAIAYTDRASLWCHVAQFSLCARDLSAALSKDTSPSLLLRVAQVLGTALGNASGGDRKNLIDVLKRLQRTMPSGETTVGQIVQLHVRAEWLLARGSPERAVALLQQADNLAPPERQHIALARAAFAASQHSTDDEKAKGMLELARQNLIAVLRPPGAHWETSFIDPPGQFVDNIDLYLRVTGAQRGQPDNDVLRTWNSLRTSKK